jgi:hypothetical protein
MISAAEFAAYNREVARIGDRAAADVESSVLAWCRSHEDATVAEKREAAKLIMEGFVQGYDDVAAEFAAQWYDRRAEQVGAMLEQAVTMTTYGPDSVDAVARYQAKKLAKGGDAAFAKACGEFARDDAFRSLNETIIANVGRDKDKGVRFARVPTGFETCTFCLMLASRGAVYHTRKTAGEFKHFHRRCDCKIVPGFGDDPDAELVEGVRPDELYELYKQFKEIESYKLPRAQEDAVKAARADAAGDGVFSRATSDGELAAYFDAGVKDALKRFRKSKTVDSYDATVNAYLSLLGDAYGIELAGERYVNRKGRCNGADPNGEELWIAVKARSSGTYLYASHEHPSVDFETGSGLVEFKTPRSIRKANDLLVNASRRFDAYPGEKKAVVVSLLRLPNAEERALTAAANFTRDGTLDEVVVLGQDGARLN